MTNYIRKMSGKQYQQRIKENPTVIIPTGACEIYGPQLPMGTDLIVAKRVAELVAEKIGALIAPTIEAGESSGLASFPCTFPMPRKILEDYLDFLISKLIQDGAKNLVFITGHAGNVDTINYVTKKILLLHKINAVQIDWWRFANSNGSDIFQFSGPMAHGHASECGTSVMLYLFPELVDLNELSRIEPPTFNKGFEDFITIKQLIDSTPNGTIGDATVATREKGERIVNQCVERIIGYISEKFK